MSNCSFLLKSRGRRFVHFKMVFGDGSLIFKVISVDRNIVGHKLHASVFFFLNV